MTHAHRDYYDHSSAGLRERLAALSEELSDQRMEQVIDYVEYLVGKESSEWNTISLHSIAGAFGEDEPEYSIRDVVCGTRRA